jgi:hypothetical protein
LYVFLVSLCVTECDTEGCFSHDILAEGCTADAERVPECADHISTGLMEEHGGYDAGMLYFIRKSFLLQDSMSQVVVCGVIQNMSLFFFRFLYSAQIRIQTSIMFL